MAQNITWLGNQYGDVPFVSLPKTGGGTALFTDVTPTTATAQDVLGGKIFFLSDGTQIVGTTSFSTIRTGSSAPSSSLGVDGDIYLQTS